MEGKYEGSGIKLWHIFIVSYKTVCSITNSFLNNQQSK